MNKDTFEGNWKQLKGKVKEKWGELTDDELDGNREQLVGKIHERYGKTKDEADEEIENASKEWSRA